METMNKYICEDCGHEFEAEIWEACSKCGSCIVDIEVD